MYIVVMCMMLLLTLGAALAAAGHQSSTAVSDDELGVRALQAAEAGAQAAVHRMNLQQPADDRCITTSVASPQTGNAWCAQTGAESVGNNASYRLPDLAARHDRLHRLGLRLVRAPALHRRDGDGGRRDEARHPARRLLDRQDPFPVDGIVGKDFIKMKNNNTVAGGVGTNGQLELANNSAISGAVQLWQNAPAPIGYSGTVQRNPTPSS